MTGANIALGGDALSSVTTGSDNIAIGHQSQSNTTGNGNIAIGSSSGGSLTSGSYNTLLGNKAGSNLTTGSGNIIIGNNIQAASNTGSSQLNIGNALYGNLSNGSVWLKNSTNSTTAFQVQNAAGAAALTVDTTTNSIVLGSGGNTVTFSAAGGLVASGTAQHQKTILLTPEYAGAVLDATSDSTCSSANNGTMTSGYNSTGRMNFYKWTSSQTSAQCYDVVVQVPIPSDFNGWASAPSISMEKDTNGTAAYAIEVIDSTGTVDSNYNYASPGTLGTTWSNVATIAFGNNSGTNGTTSYVPGGYFTIKVRMSSTSGANVSLGNISLTYNSEF